MFMVDYDYEPLPADPVRLADEPATADTGYRTRTIGVSIPDAGHFIIRALLDRQQYWDPDGKAEKLGMSPALWPLFGMLWPASLHLAAHLAQRPVQAHESMLEIGCGLALASLVAHRRGAKVTASDCHPLAHDFLMANLQLNNLPPTLEYRHGQWGLTETLTDQQAGRPVLRGQFDFIMASDVLYDRDCPAAVAELIHLHSQPGTEVWVVEANRGYRPAFNRHMSGHGFALEEDIRLENRVQVQRNMQPFKGHLLKYRRTG